MKALNKFILQLTAVVFGVMLAGAALAQPANDLCTGAITVTCGTTVTGNTNTSTIDAPPACGLTFPRYGVWYKFAGTGQSVTLSTCSATTNFDTQIGVFSGSCTGLVCVAGNNDDYSCSSNNRNSTLTFSTNCGTDYYIWVTGKLSSRGAFSMSVACTGTACGANPCTNVATVSCGTSTTTALTGAGIWNLTSCGFSTPGNERIYQFTAPTTGNYTLQITAANPTGYIDYYYKPVSAGCGSTDWICIDDNFSTGSDVFSLTAGTYYILLDAEGTTARTHTWQINCPAGPPPPGDNDACANATTIACGGSASGTTVGATTDGPTTSCTGTSVAPDRWYVVTGNGGTITASMCTGTSYDSKLDIYTGTCGALTSVACNDDFCGLQSQVSWASTAGVQYRIRVHGYAGATGAYTLTVTCTTPLVEGVNNNPVEVANVGKLSVGEFFPNPAQFDNTNVKIYSPNESNARIVLFDNLGRAVHNQEVELYSGENNVELQLNNLAIGTYFAAINVNGETIRKKLVIVR